MARPLRIAYPAAFYHVASRGNEQKNVFKSQKDREKFLSYLKSVVVRRGTVVHTGCLMHNHHHLLLETPSGNLATIMRRIMVYTRRRSTSNRRGQATSSAAQSSRTSESVSGSVTRQYLRQAG